MEIKTFNLKVHLNIFTQSRVHLFLSEAKDLNTAEMIELSYFRESSYRSRGGFRLFYSLWMVLGYLLPPS